MTTPPTQDHPLPEPDTLFGIVADVFAGMLGSDEAVPYLGDPAAVALPVTGSVTCSGAWTADVAVSCTESLARTLAAELFRTPVEEIVEDDVRDAVGEVANVIGGNVKSMMPGPSVLSLPATSLHARPGDLSDGSLRLDLAWRDQPLCISVRPVPSNLHNTWEQA